MNCDPSKVERIVARMQVFVATQEMQGITTSKTSDLQTGEIAFWDPTCILRHGNATECQCLNGFVGTSTGRMSTTARVTPFPGSLVDYADADRKSVV